MTLDMVHQPQHYISGIFSGQCIDVVEYVDFCRENAIKYLWRYQQKNGVEDIRKAAWYLERLSLHPENIIGSIPQNIRESLNDQAVAYSLSTGGKRDSTYHAMFSICLLASLEDNTPSDIKVLTVMLAYNATQTMLDLEEKK